MSATARPRLRVLLLAAIVLSFAGCTSFREYLSNGLKVGPNYCPAAAPVAKEWIDEAKLRVEPDPEVLAHWWTVFNDERLNNLIYCAYRQNLNLRQAVCRVLQARAYLAIRRGELFPQSQQAFGDYRRIGTPTDILIPPTYLDNWDFGFSLQWELDLWGRLRRQVIAAKDDLEASVYDYNGVLVTLLGDVARYYVQVRTDQERIKLLEANAKLQRDVLRFIEMRFNAGFKQTELDLDQAISNLRQTEASIEPLSIDLRQAQNQLCILMGIPPTDLASMLHVDTIPTAPPDAVVGIPSDLLRRRPDVLRAERIAAAQAEEIGIAQADLYPLFTLNGTIGYDAGNFRDLFHANSFGGSVGPSFQWNLLNYGRIVNNVRYQDAQFQELVFAFQQKVLQAHQEVEDGLVTFLRSQRRTRIMAESVAAAEKAVKIVIIQYENGAVDFNRYATIEQNLVTQQDLHAQARGQIAQGLIAVYRALGGGWEIHLGGEEPPPPEAMPAPPNQPEQVPAPAPNAPNPPQEAPPAPGVPQPAANT